MSPTILIKEATDLSHVKGIRGVCVVRGSKRTKQVHGVNDPSSAHLATDLSHPDRVSRVIKSTARETQNADKD